MALLLTGSNLWQAWAKARPFVVVIDAGHGGKDPGARRGGLQEKDITLGVALHLGELIKANHSGIKVLYTRNTDRFVGLQERADFANSHKASLFVSIHVNSAPGAVSGTETFVLGVEKQDNNFSVALRENQVMELEDNYKTTYKEYNRNKSESIIAFKLMQEAYQERSIEMARLVEAQYRKIGRRSRGVRQAPFWVLSQSAMPSILTEIGFITDPAEAKFLSSKEGQAAIARALYRAVVKFYSSTTNAPTTSTVEDEPALVEGDTASAPLAPKTKSAETSTNTKPNKQSQTSCDGLRYRVQFMAVSKRIDTKDKQFSWLKVPIYRMKYKNIYRYMAGNTGTLAEARSLRSHIQKYYKDAYIVSIDKSGAYQGRVE